MTTLNQLTDAVETQVKAAIPSLRFYSEGESKPESDAAVMLFRGRRWAADCGSQISLWSIEVSATIGDREQWRAYRLLRDFLSHEGALSIEAAIEADTTLGIAGVSVEVKNAEQERVRGFSDGKRVTGFLQLEIQHD